MSYLLSSPNDIIFLICEHLNPVELIKLISTCKNLYSLCSSKEFRNNVIKKDLHKCSEEKKHNEEEYTYDSFTIFGLLAEASFQNTLKNKILPRLRTFLTLPNIEKLYRYDYGVMTNYVNDGIGLPVHHEMTRASLVGGNSQVINLIESLVVCPLKNILASTLIHSHLISWIVAVILALRPKTNVTIVTERHHKLMDWRWAKSIIVDVFGDLFQFGGIISKANKMPIHGNTVKLSLKDGGDIIYFGNRSSVKQDNDLIDDSINIICGGPVGISRFEPKIHDTVKIRGILKEHMGYDIDFSIHTSNYINSFFDNASVLDIAGPIGNIIGKYPIDKPSKIRWIRGVNVQRFIKYIALLYPTLDSVKKTSYRFTSSKGDLDSLDDDYDDTDETQLSDNDMPSEDEIDRIMMIE
jgi:hypothetical protein